MKIDQSDRANLRRPDAVARMRMVPPPIFHGPDSSGLSFRFFWDLDSRLSSALIAHFRPFNEGLSPTARYSADGSIRDELIRVIAQSACVELALARLAGRLVGKTHADRYASFIEATGTDEFRSYFLSKYPVIGARAQALVERTYALFQQISSAFDADREALLERLGVPLETQIVDVLPLGDAHHEGQRACKLNLSDGTVLMYKPRSSDADRTIAELAESMGEPFSGWLKVGHCLERNGYHWQEWLDSGSQWEERDDDYYQAAGAWLAFSYYTATRDLHLENLLSARDGLWAVDLECAFNSVPTDPDQPLTFRMAVLDSVNSAAILPLRVGGSIFVEGQNQGALGGLSDDLSGMARWEVSDDGTDQLAIRRKFGELQDPRDEPIVSRTIAHVDSIQEGFARTRKKIRSMHAEFRAAAERPELTTRVVVRPTMRYFEAIVKSCHPAALIDKSTCLAVLREHLKDGSPYGDDAFLDAECESMYLLDIPVYYVPPAASSLPGPVADVPLLSGASAVDRRLDELLQDSDLNRHADTFAKSFAAYGSSVRSDNHELLNAREGENESVELDLVKNVVRDLASSIWNARNGVQPSNWLNAMRAPTNRWTLSSSDYGLYDGLAGIFLGLANAHRLLNSEDIGAMVAELYADLLDVSDATTLGNISVGAFGGVSGLAYALAAGAQLGYDHDSQSPLAIERLARLCTQKMGERDEVDVIGGAAGCLLVFAELLRVGLVDEVVGEACCDRAVELLLDRAEVGPVPDSLTWNDEWSKTWLGGVSHGVTGIEWAARRYAKVRPQKATAVERLAEGARLSQDSLAGENVLLWADRRPVELVGNPPMQAWCHGSEGIILARLDMRSDVTTKEALELIISRLIRLPLTTNPSVCHGIAGRVIAVDEANRYGPHMPGLALRVGRQISELEFALLDIASRQRTINASSIELWNEGFMIGRAGIVWTLAKLRLPHIAIEPSLLRLNSEHF